MSTFAETKREDKGRFNAWFEARARAHPGVFTAGLVVLAALITIGLLYKTETAIILYQGF